MQINIPIQTRKPEKITVDEVRLELRKIEEEFFGNLARGNMMYALNDALNQRINIPYGLNIKAELIGINVKLFGYTKESKEVLDLDFEKDFIEKVR
jgi:hypothetical protein